MNGHIKKVAKIAVNKVPMKPVVDRVVEVLRQESDVKLPAREVKKQVEGAMKVALKKAVKKAASRIVEKAS
jgi:ribosomal protein S3